MKKFISALFVCVLSALVLTSCGKKSEAAKNVENMINGLAEVVIGADSEEAISEIESAYNALSDEEKKNVKNYDKLEEAKEELSSAQEKIESINETNSAISEIIDAANAEHSGANTDYSALLQQAQDILNSYDKLPDSEKESIDMSDELNDAVESISSYIAIAQEATAAYVKAFNSVYANEKYEVSAVYCIKQIREGTQYHIFALTYKDGSGKEHNLYSNARCSANTTAQTIISHADTFFAKNAVSEEYNAILGSNIELDLEAVLALAK